MSNKHIIVFIILSYFANIFLKAEPNIAQNNKAVQPISIVKDIVNREL